MNRRGGPTWPALVLLAMVFSFVLASEDHIGNPSYLARTRLHLAQQSVVPREGARDSKAFPETVSITAEKMKVDVEGFKMLTIHERVIYAFQGIRYAPLPERFQPPIMVEEDYYEEENEDGILKANHLPEKCAQRGFLDPSLAVGTEDCLFLNVYTPQLQNEDDGKYNDLLPVMLFIHGGGFVFGDTSIYMPTRLLDRDVILVTIQYRLGSFGFFSTGDSTAKGNAGIYDQQMAMKWVQEYIGDFGGDMNRVTIFGQSAGSSSVTHHLLSKSSAGLFKGVIAESGSALDYWSIDPDPVGSATAIAEIQNCPDTSDMTAVYECMLELPMEELVWGISELSANDREEGQLGFRGTSPIVQDFLTEEEEPIIYYPPEQVFHSGTFNTDVSLMIGANRDEGSYIFGVMYSAFLVPNGLVNDSLFIQEDMIPTLLHSFGVSDKTHALSESLALEYLGNDVDRSDLKEVTPGMIDMSGVLFEKGGVYESAKYHSLGRDESVNASTFFYTFDYLSDDTIFDWLFVGTTLPPFEHGVTHGDELMYIFSLPADQDEEDKQTNDRMVELWTNFAIYYHPTPSERTDKLINMSIDHWSQFDVELQQYMVMEDTFHTEQDYTLRWTINTNEKTVEHSSTTDVCMSYKDEYDRLESDYDELERTSNIYMGLMISFIVLFAIEGCAAGYLFYKLYYA